MRRVDNPFCLDPKETSCPRLKKLGMEWDPVTGSVKLSEPSPQTASDTPTPTPTPTPRRPIDLYKDITGRNPGGSKLDPKILPQRVNVEGLTKAQLNSAKLCRAAKLYYTDGPKSAQDYLDGEFGEGFYEIQPELSGKYHITVKTSEGFEIASRGIESGNSMDAIDLYNLTNNPRNAESYKEIMDTYESLEGNVDTLHGYSRGGKVMLHIGAETGTDVIAHSPAIGSNELALSGENSVEIVRPDSDFASSLLGLGHPDNWNVHVYQSEPGTGSIEQHFLRNNLNAPSTDIDIYGAPLRGELDPVSTTASAVGAVGLVTGVVETGFHAADKQTPKELEYTNIALGESMAAYETPSYFEATTVGSEAAWINEKLLDNSGITGAIANLTGRGRQNKQLQEMLKGNPITQPHPLAEDPLVQQQQPPPANYNEDGSFEQEGKTYVEVPLGGGG